MVYNGQSRTAGMKGPNPCPRCELVYTPGFYAEHVRSYHSAAFVPVWRRRALDGQGLGKDLSGAVLA